METMQKQQGAFNGTAGGGGNGTFGGGGGGEVMPPPEYAQAMFSYESPLDWRSPMGFVFFYSMV